MVHLSPRSFPAAYTLSEMIAYGKLYAFAILIMSELIVMLKKGVKIYQMHFNNETEFVFFSPAIGRQMETH